MSDAPRSTRAWPSSKTHQDRPALAHQPPFGDAPFLVPLSRDTPAVHQGYRQTVQRRVHAVEGVPENTICIRLRILRILAALSAVISSPSRITSPEVGISQPQKDSAPTVGPCPTRFSPHEPNGPRPLATPDRHFVHRLHGPLSLPRNGKMLGHGAGLQEPLRPVHLRGEKPLARS